MEHQSEIIDNYEDPSSMYSNEYSYQHNQYPEIDNLEEDDNNFASEIDKLKQMFDRKY